MTNYRKILQQRAVIYTYKTTYKHTPMRTGACLARAHVDVAPLNSDSQRNRSN